MEEVPAKGNPFRKLIPARYVLAVLGSIGMGIVYGLKVNLSVALVGMLNHTALHELSKELSHDNTTSNAQEDDGCVAENSTTTVEDGPFLWSEPLQGMLLSCYFWGYFISQIPGGRIAEMFSAKWVMFFSVFINVICTLLTPAMATWHYVAVIAMRIGEGIGGGMALPALYCLIGRWGLPDERRRMTFMVHVGTTIGGAKAYLTGTNVLRSWGWESVFYVMGGLSTTWCFLWIVFVQDSPQQQPYIDQEERDMLVNALGSKPKGSTKKLPVPWKAVLTSPPFLAIMVAHTCSNWGWYMLLIELPFYMKQVLKFNITENAVVTAIPFLTLWLFSLGLSRTLDYLKVKGTITTTTSRKIGTLFASCIPLICLLGLCYIGCHRTLAVVLMAIGVTCIGGMFCGFLSNHIDIAPNFAGTLMAITNTMATIPGIIVPIFVGQLTHGNQTISAWRVIFFVTIGLYVIEILVYMIFGSGEEQPWNRPEKCGDEEDLKMENQPLNEKLKVEDTNVH
ncbi:major facilitator superfamily transporter 3 isoform X2 [Arctopsyche grandis]|uniref:major facilitator superfamily transporter 3 isoform X2 n=1 Tax=Arctopsyche grandis TaxID=121162 RepID=UPI00406D6603